MNNCKKFDFFTFGEIPQSYLLSLTYEEQILKIIEQICEIGEYLKQFSYEKIDELMNEKIQELKSYIDIQDEKLYNYINEELEIKINEVTALLYEKVSFLLNYINNSNNVLKEQFMQELEKIKAQIDEIVIKGINVYNPTTGKYDNIQNVVYDLYKYLRYLGIKAVDFDNLGLTCEEFENKQLTARQFDLYSKDILQVNFNHEMYSPFTGHISKLSTVINQLANLHKNDPITAIQFDELELTSLTFDNKEISTYDFDFNAKTLLNI